MEKALKSLVRATYMNNYDKDRKIYKKPNKEIIDIIVKNIVWNGDFWRMIERFILDEMEYFKNERGK